MKNLKPTPNCLWLRLSRVAWLLPVLLLLTLSTVAQAQSTTGTSGGLVYTSSKSQIAITGYSGTGGAVSIPATINGLPVTSIGENAFEDCTSLTNMTIPNSVTTIAQGAFLGCRRLTSVTIPDSVTSIGEEAFDTCAHLTSVTIPTSITSIGEGTFENCASLTSVTIPNSVTSIGEEAFENCTNLASVTISKSVTSIADEAFNGCSSMAIVTIPDKVTSIGIEVFGGCTRLTSALFMGNAPSMGRDVFYATASDFTVYYLNGATGFAPTWNSYPALALAAPSPASAIVTTSAWTPFLFQIVNTDIATSYGATGLPSGVTCNAGTGLISGTPVHTGTFSVTLEASNPAGSGTGTLTLMVQPLPLIVTTGTVTGITASEAVLSGKVNPGGQAASYYFEYGLTANFGSQSKTVSAGSGITALAVKATLTHLSPATAYCYRLIAVNTSGTTYGETATFTTGGAPQAETDPAVASTVRTLVSGSANPDGLATSVHFQYGAAAATGTAIVYSNKTPAQSAGAEWEWESFSATLTGLKPGTQYHYRIVAVNSSGTVSGSDGEFTTPGSAPEIVASGTATGATVFVTGTGESVADVDALLGPQSGVASACFQYGLTAAYGKTTGTAALIGGSTCTASATLCGLLPHTAYHVRSVVQSGRVKSYSPDVTFQTLPRFDLNGDGFSELLWWSPATGQTTLAFSSGSLTTTGTLAISGTEAGPVLPTDLTFRGEAEFNPNGDQWTLAWVLTGTIPAQTEFLLFEDNSLSVTGTFPLITGTFLAPAGATVAAVADIDGDGNPDLVLAGPKNEITFWLLDGFTVVAQKRGPTLPTGFEIVSMNNLNGNGKPDMLLWNPASGATKLLVLNGTQEGSISAGPSIPLSGGFQLAGANVYTGTTPEWLLYNPANQTTQIWTVKGTKAQSIDGPNVPRGMRLLGTE